MNTSLESEIEMQVNLNNIDSSRFCNENSNEYSTTPLKMGQMMIEWTDCRKLPRKDVSLAHYTISHDLCTRAVADQTDRLLFQLLQFCHLDMN